MRKIEGNEHFRDRVEYTTIVRYYFGDGWYRAAQLGLNGALQSLNIVSVIQSAQVIRRESTNSPLTQIPWVPKSKEQWE